MKATKIFRIFGIDVKLHISWWFVFILIAWSLSELFFPHHFEGYNTITYWFMGIVASLLLFVSVLLHELAHSLVAKAKKIKVESITLFFFGGVAGITKEDMKPSSELLMALAGPAFSLILAAVFLAIFKFDGNGILTAITYYLYQLNFILALFNLVPGFPLDGGRAFRAILYWYYKDLRKATRIAAAGGKFFAGVLIFMGIFSLIGGAGTGLWLIFLGAFLYFIAGMSYEQVVLKGVLDKIPVTELLKKKIPKLNPEMKFIDFVRRNMNSEEDAYLVQNKRFSGLIDVNKLHKMPPKMQELVRLKQIAIPFNQMKSVKKKDNAYTAFRLFSTQNVEILPVSDKKKVVGYISRKALMHRLAWMLNYSAHGKVGRRMVRRVRR